MADVDIDPFGEMNRGLNSQLMNIFLFLQLPQWEEEEQLGNQHMNRKRHSEESLKNQTNERLC